MVDQIPSPMKKLFLSALVLTGLCLATAPLALAQQGGGAALLLGGNGPAPGPNSFAINSITPLTPKTPEYTTLGGDAQNKKYTLGTWLQIDVDFAAAVRAPELTFHYNILIGGALLVGDQTLVDVAPGRNLFTTVFVSPRTLTTLLRGQPLTPNSVQNVNVQILRSGVAQPLTSKSLKEGGAPFYATMQQVPGFVLNKGQTPFGPLWYDHYEVIKDPPAGR